MNKALSLVGMGLSVAVGYMVGKKGSHISSSADASFFRTNHGSDGFCEAEVLKKKMKGRAFHWQRVGVCRPPAGGYFEIRVKDKTSPLIPARPQGVDNIFADVHGWAATGDVYEYSLFEVLPDGRERELEDPELEIGQI